jgi:hypothetical protein
MNKIFVFIVMCSVLFSIGFSTASGDHGATFEMAEEIIEQKISCDELTEDHLEILGDYYMEQMHPGELHEIMDEMMGGEGSLNLRLIHINMGKAFYCGEHDAMSDGMMNMMMGRSGMMVKGGMMGNSYYDRGIYGLGVFNWVLMILILVVLILFIIWLVNQLLKPKRRRKRK